MKAKITHSSDPALLPVGVDATLMNDGLNVRVYAHPEPTGVGPLVATIYDADITFGMEDREFEITVRGYIYLPTPSTYTRRVSFTLN